MCKFDQKKEYDMQEEIYKIFGKDTGGIIWSYARPLTNEEINFKDMLEELVNYFIPSCDCCCKGWGIKNEFGRCWCWCDNCGKYLFICRYKCFSSSSSEPPEIPYTPKLLSSMEVLELLAGHRQN